MGIILPIIGLTAPVAIMLLLLSNGVLIHTNLRDINMTFKE